MSKKQKILELRAKGHSYKQIVKMVGCSISTVSYHCGEGQKEKNRNRNLKNRDTNVLVQKCHRFQKRKSRRALQSKSDDFQRERTPNGLGKHLDKTFNYKDVLSKFGEETECYLTGRKINLREPSTYQFDHIVSVAKGGLNTLDNLGIAYKEANRAKSDLSVKEFLDLCKEVLEYNGYEVKKSAMAESGLRR